jgi:hemerythrin superfamily protein
MIINAEQAKEILRQHLTKEKHFQILERISEQIRTALDHNAARTDYEFDLSDSEDDVRVVILNLKYLGFDVAGPFPFQHSHYITITWYL